MSSICAQNPLHIYKEVLIPLLVENGFEVIGEEEDAVLGDFVAGNEPPPEEEVEVTLRRDAVRKVLNSLPARERQVIILRYGLDGAEKPETLESIGRQLGLPRERVRQIELETLRRLSALHEMLTAR